MKLGRVLILGAQGQLGVELQREFADYADVVAMGREGCDLSRPETIPGAIAESEPEIILNAAAYTAVDRAESEPDLANRVNGEAPGVLAEEAKRRNALLVHYSTDYVFDGTKQGTWVESDKTNPLNVYGASKLLGEQNIAASGARHLIFRTSWVYSPHGQNFLRTMLRLGAERDQLRIVDNQFGAPTTALALARATRQVLEHPWSPKHAGIYHMTCGGETSWCGFAKAIFEKSAPPTGKSWPAVTGIPDTEYPTPARRPENSRLSNDRLKRSFGVELPSWRIALEETLGRL
ncbi:dTDP-4-dehydrorhamnose reductase [Silvibacterium acidisoli]|uniref:dTDP-4-dehydrorhamnose reductase n=1 Tax=Acidobacteriaceae bacterium ZG23-2 TaxID=2883246 RepID=UPI00406C3ADD